MAAKHHLQIGVRDIVLVLGLAAVHLAIHFDWHLVLYAN